MKSKPTPPRPAAKAPAKAPAKSTAPGAPEPRFRNVLPGDPAIFFRARAATNPSFNFDTVGGRYVLLAFVGSTHEGSGGQAVKALGKLMDAVDGDRMAAFAVSVYPRDEKAGAIKADPPQFNVFWDFDLAVSRAYGAAAMEPSSDGQEPFRPLWFILDPTLRPLFILPAPADDAGVKIVRDLIKGLPPSDVHGGMAAQAPALFIPRVFEPALCKALIEHYKKSGGEESGFMRDIEGKTTLVLDPTHKRRRDAQIDDEALMNAARERVRRRIVPEIRKAFQFEVTRIERDIVACYREEDASHFRAHRDNTTRGTAHRRFAVSINLNDDFEGGTLSFPEYSTHQYKIPAGGAVVFSCNLLHKVAPITRGERFAYLPFLYDDAAAKVREENAKHLDEKVGGYRDARSVEEPMPAVEKAAKAGQMAFEDDEPVI